MIPSHQTDLLGSSGGGGGLFLNFIVSYLMREFWSIRQFVMWLNAKLRGVITGCVCPSCCIRFAAVAASSNIIHFLVPQCHGKRCEVSGGTEGQVSQKNNFFIEKLAVNEFSAFSCPVL